MSQGEHYSFKCNLHIAIIYFDEIIGPKILNIYPEVSEERTQKVNMVLRHLLDIGSLKAQSERQFMYSDRDFSSLNLYFSIPSSVARGGYFDFMVSLIVTPTYPELISAMAMDWNSLYELQIICEPVLKQQIVEKMNIHDPGALQFMLATNLVPIKENIQYNLEIISPNSFELI